MAINFNTTPYYDDYDEEKNFYRVLFKPGAAVQARELNQLQTTLQNQISRFGQNIFKEGSLVVPGHSSIDLYAKYVKLAVSYNSIESDTVIADLLNTEVIGQNSGIRALVIDYLESTASDPATIYVKYLNSGTSKTASAFSDDEVLTNEAGTISIKTASSNATGNGIRFSIQPGIIFVRNIFSYFTGQNVIVSKYDNSVSKSVGFNIVESIVTSDEDESLLDPAIGTYNYFAPGADRYKILLTLVARDFYSSDNDPDYVELARIESGVLISQKKTSDYNILNDTLARRTFDESGNYTVRPYKLELLNHLRTSNSSVRDGLYTTAQGGNSDLYVGIVSPGKSYVLGYELENLKTQYISIPKARDYVAVNQGTVSTEIGNYILITSANSAPDISSHTEIDLYNRFTTSDGNPAGTKVGTAKPRALEYYSGSGTSTVYKLYLFDVNIQSPYTFENDVKQVYYNNSGFFDFTANIVPNLYTLTGSLSTTHGSATVTGIGTSFSTELSANDYISINGNISEVISVTNNNQLTVLANLVGNVSGFTGYRLDANIVLPEKNSYIFELPYSTIKTVDPTSIETTYYTRRVYDRTLSVGSVTITAGTNEVFTPYTVSDYIAINKTTGITMPLTGNVSLGGSPTGKTITFSLGSTYGSNDVRLFTTVAKSNNAADKKTKTLNSTFIDFTYNTNATATLSLAQADVYRVQNVLMSANTFGNVFLITESTDITSRYTLDNGQRKTHYDIGKLFLKPGSPKPTGPVRVYFQYFTHSAGDYCTVESYPDLTYDTIPSFNDGTKIFKLRDCIDFRPVIDTNGTTFTNPTEFLNQSVYFTTDYQYYLGKIDKIVIDSTGTIKSVSGASSLTPSEPATPENSMALYVLKQNPYVFDAKSDIEINVVDNKRFTMRDIGRIENRVKNLEYYTELSLLELQTKAFTIKDSQGLDRFKNGFVVDNFTGHNIGDPTNKDYSVAMDFAQGEIRPMFVQINIPLIEVSSSTSQRSSNNYVMTGNIASLPYTSNLFIECNVASRVENVNPFNVTSHIGSIALNPPADVWFETEKLPDLYVNQEKILSTLQYDSAAKGTYNTIWNNWELVWVGGKRSEQRTGTSYKTYEKIDTTTSDDIIVSKTVVPKMRSAYINFDAVGLKPNTKLRVYFDGYDVTSYCKGNYTAEGTLLSDANVSVRLSETLNSLVINTGNIITDTRGSVSGTFFYDANFFNLNTGSKVFRLTDSPTNGSDSETSAEAIFNSTGEKRQIRNEIVSTRYTYTAQEATYDVRDVSGQSLIGTLTDYTAPGTTPEPEPVIVDKYLPASDVVSNFIVQNNVSSIGNEDINGVKSLSPGVSTDKLREMTAGDSKIQTNATTLGTNTTFADKAAGWFTGNGKLDVAAFASAVGKGSTSGGWSEGLTASEINKTKEIMNEIETQIKNSITNGSGVLEIPLESDFAKSSVLQDCYAAVLNGGTPLGGGGINEAIKWAAAITTVSLVASQSNDSAGFTWQPMASAVVDGNQTIRK